MWCLKSRKEWRRLEYLAQNSNRWQADVWVLQLEVSEEPE